MLLLKHQNSTLQTQAVENCSSCTRVDGLRLAFSAASQRSESSRSPGNTGTGAPTVPFAHQCSQRVQAHCKGHAFTTWNSPSKLPDYPTEGFSVLLRPLPCSMKEMCSWELSDLELAPPAGANAGETVSGFKCCDSLRQLSSYLPVSCCTRKRCNGAESNTFCLLSQDLKAWTITKTGNRKRKLWFQLNKLAGL